jgi:RND family efflux transporter MFP subunit
MIASFQATMRIEKIMVEVGDNVKAGQLLVQMEQSNYLQAKLQIENLKVDYNRIESLYQTGGVSKQQLDQLKVQLDVTQEALENLEKNTFLKSPGNGIITMRNFDNGDLTGGQPILQVQQLNPLKVSINIQESYFPQVKRQMPASVRLESYPDEVFEGRVNLIHPTIDPISHTFTTEIVVNNAGMRIRPGMFARVSFNFGSVERVVVPDVAVIRQSGVNDRYVYVLNANNTVSYIKVTLGQRMGSTYEILSGLNDGDRVVIAGASRLIDGVTVKVVD